MSEQTVETQEITENVDTKEATTEQTVVEDGQGVVDTENTEDVNEDVTASDNNSDNTSDNTSDNASESPKPKKTIDERLAELKRQTWEAREAQRQLAEAQAKLQQVQQEEEALEEPNIDNYNDDDSYKKDLQKFYHKKASIEIAKQLKEQQVQQQQAKELSDTMAMWDFKRTQEIERNPNFEQNEIRFGTTLRQLTSPQNAALLAQAITTSPNGVHLVNYLANHTKEIEKIAKLSPMSAAMELGVINAKLSQTTKKITTAPTPVSPVNGSSAPVSDLSKMSYADYEAKMNRQEFGK